MLKCREQQIKHRDAGVSLETAVNHVLIVSFMSCTSYAGNIVRLVKHGHVVLRLFFSFFLFFSLIIVHGSYFNDRRVQLSLTRIFLPWYRWSLKYGNVTWEMNKWNETRWINDVETLELIRKKGMFRYLFDGFV